LVRRRGAEPFDAITSVVPIQRYQVRHGGFDGEPRGHGGRQDRRRVLLAALAGEQLHRRQADDTRSNPHGGEPLVGAQREVDFGPLARRTIAGLPSRASAST